MFLYVVSSLQRVVCFFSWDLAIFLVVLGAKTCFFSLSPSVKIQVRFFCFAADWIPYLQKDTACRNRNNMYGRVIAGMHTYIYIYIVHYLFFSIWFYGFTYLSLHNCVGFVNNTMYVIILTWYIVDFCQHFSTGNVGWGRVAESEEEDDDDERLFYQVADPEDCKLYSSTSYNSKIIGSREYGDVVRGQSLQKAGTWLELHLSEAFDDSSGHRRAYIPLFTNDPEEEREEVLEKVPVKDYPRPQRWKLGDFWQHTWMSPAIYSWGFQSPNVRGWLGCTITSETQRI